MPSPFVDPPDSDKQNDDPTLAPGDSVSPGAPDDLYRSPRGQDEWEKIMAATNPDKAESVNNLYKGLGAYQEARGERGDKGQLIRRNLGKNVGRKNLRSKFSVKKRVQMSVASMLITAVLGIGGGGALYMAGPGQLIMLSEIFKDFSLGAFEDDGDDFSNRVARRLVARDAGEARLSLAGQKMYRHMDDGLKKRGLEFDVDSDGTLKGIKKDGILVQDFEGANQRTRRAGLRTELRNNGIGRLQYYTRYRPLMQARFRINFTFFENTKRNIRQGARDRANRAYEKLKEKVTNGDASAGVDRTRTDDADGDPETDDDPTNDEQLDAAESEADAEAGKISEDVANGDSPGKASGKFKARLKLAGAGALGITLIGCQIIALDEQAENIAKTERLIPLVRLANSFYAAADQVRAGAIGALEEIGELLEVVNSPEVRVAIDESTGYEYEPPPTGLSFLSSPAYAQATEVQPAMSWFDTGEAAAAVGTPWRGKPRANEAVMPSASERSGIGKVIGEIADFFTESIPGYESFCNVTSSGIGAFAIRVFDFATAPASSAIGLAIERSPIGDKISEILMSFINGGKFNMDAMTPHDVPGAILAGSDISASQSANSGGAWKISDTQATERKVKHIIRRRKEFAQRPLYDRIFDYAHPDSFITQATFKVPKNRQQLATAIVNMPKTFLSSFAKMVFPAARAADGDCRGEPTEECLAGFDSGVSEDAAENGGMQHYGFSEERMQMILAVEPDFAIDWYEGNENDDGSPASPFGKIDPDYKAKYDKCFDSDPSGASTDAKLSDDEHADCDEEFGNDANISTEAIRFQAARAYTASGEGFACLADDPSECPAQSGGQTSGSSASCGQPSGTPEEIINNVVFPIVHSIPGFEAETIEANVAANEAHSTNTTSGNVSDHKGPPERAWATDISNGSNPTPEMDELAQKLADCFGIDDWQNRPDCSTSDSDEDQPPGLITKTVPGYRLQLIYRTQSGGNHCNHVHFGVRAE